jgi:AAA+ ATPase superfamily predicted ATPase
VKILDFGIEFSTSRQRPSFSSILEALDECAGDEGTRLVIVLVFDEAQELNKLRGYTILPSLAYAYDNLKNLSFVFIGSKVGLLYRFLRINDSSSPLYGRYFEKIILSPLSRDLALKFLRRGFEEHGMSVSEDFLHSAVEALDGIIGWLTFLGLRALRMRFDKSVIKEVLEEASKISINEFCNFVEVMGTKRYVEILRAIGKEGATWSQVRRYLELRVFPRQLFVVTCEYF